MGSDGAKQKRCPRCKKLRRFVEGGDTYERKERSQRWSKVKGRWVCFMCVPVIPVRQNDAAITPAPGKLHQCKTCPWKVAADPHAIPNYVPELARALKCTITTDPAASLFAVLGGSLRMMACHYSKPGEEFPCAGWLENQFGPGNNIGLRLLALQGRCPCPSPRASSTSATRTRSPTARTCRSRTTATWRTDAQAEDHPSPVHSRRARRGD